MQTTTLARPRPSVEAAAQAVVLMGGPVRAAKLLGADRYQRVQAWMANGLPVEFCARVERAISGKLTRREFYPLDWSDIWPELVEEGPDASDPATAQEIGREVVHG